MNGPIKIVHLEDNPQDADLLQSLLEEDGIPCSIRRVETRPEFETALSEVRFDLIISDFSLPSFDGLSALDIARQKCPDVPFIFLSGTIGEEAAVESLKKGAVDYVLKDRIPRLVAAVRRAIQEARDRAERRRIQEELRQRDALFRLITENVDDLIAVLDLEGRRVFNSPSYGPLLGDLQLLAGTESFSEIHPADRERIRRIFQETVKTGVGQRAEYRFLLKDGTARFVESQGSVIRDAQGQVTNVVVVSRDITKRKQAEIKVHEQAALLDKATDAIFVRDLEQRITYWNKGAERMYGWTAQEVLGSRADKVLYREDAPQRDAIWKTVLEKGEWSGELRQVTKTGQELVVESHRTLLRDEEGKPAAIFNINTDVTERKKIEAQLLRAQRVENIGALAGGIAHDLNNVLAPILMVSDLLRDELASEESRKMLDTAKASAQRGGEMVKQILSFARGMGGERVEVQLKHLVKEMAKLVRDTFPRSISVHTTVSERLPPILGDATQLHQVLLNLCVNARDAMPQGGSLKIEAESVVLDRRQTRMQHQPASGPYVLLTVTDTGTGMSPEIQEKIFEPFFTTKGQGKGTGLGLSTVMSIVKNHGGFIEVESRAAQGSSFKVYLPGAAATEGPLKPESLAELPVGNGEVILLVDDEQAILEITKETLKSYNYRVLAAVDGVEAVTAFRQQKGKVHIVVTDMMMPVMDGPTLIRALRQIDPQVRIIGMSGLASRTRLEEVDKLNLQGFVTKPYTTERLLRTLRQVLDVG